MPQMNKGGKFIFGKSLIREDLTIHLPPQALTEYNATAEGKVYLFTWKQNYRRFLRDKEEFVRTIKIGTHSFC